MEVEITMAFFPQDSEHKIQRLNWTKKKKRDEEQKQTPENEEIKMIPATSGCRLMYTSRFTVVHGGDLTILRRRIHRYSTKMYSGFPLNLSRPCQKSLLNIYYY